MHISNLDVAGAKGEVFVSIAHFPINDHTFWEVVMAGGVTEGATIQVRDEVVNLLRTEIHPID